MPQPTSNLNVQTIRRMAASALIAMLAWLSVGCGTTTSRMATEQLLMSDAVDQAISQIDFRSLEGKTVFLDTLYLHSVKGVGFVNSEYIISSLRQQLTAARCLIQDNREMAEVIVEPRVGALGTDGHEIVYGIPQSSSITNAAAMFSSAPLPAIPEISFSKRNALAGIAKIIVFAYDRETREPVWQSGIAKSESTSSDTWILGAGPFQKGSIYDGTRFAGRKLPPAPQFDGTVLNGRGPFLRQFDSTSAAAERPISKDVKPDIVQYQYQHTFTDEADIENLIPPAVSPDAIDDPTVQVDPAVQKAQFEKK